MYANASLFFWPSPLPFFFFSFSQWLHSLSHRTLKNIGVKLSLQLFLLRQFFSIGFLFPPYKLKQSGFCPTTQLKWLPIVNENSLIGKYNHLFVDFILLDILSTQGTLATSGLLKFHPLASWFCHPGSSNHTAEYPHWLLSHLLSVPTCGPNSHSFLI